MHSFRFILNHLQSMIFSLSVTGGDVLPRTITNYMIRFKVVSHIEIDMPCVAGSWINASHDLIRF